MAGSATMKAIQIKEFNAPFAVSVVPKPKPKPNQVLLKIHAGGFCHSDIMALNNEFNTPLPYIGSHEPAGVVAEVGSEVKAYKVGDRVGAITFDQPCGKCPDCKAGSRLYCDKFVRSMKGITIDGAWAEYMLADPSSLVTIPSSVSFEVAAVYMCAGLTIYGSIIKAQLPANGAVAIIGIGGLGHIGTQIAKAMGYTVIAVDTKQAALDVANSFKHRPDICMKPGTDSVDSILSQLEEIHSNKFGFRGVDAAIIATNRPPGFRTAAELTRKHGKLVLVGLPADVADTDKGTDLMELVEKEDIKVHVTTWKPEQAEEMRQKYLRGESEGKNVVVF